MNKNTIRIIGVLASLAAILSLCVAVIALVPAFGQWLSTREQVKTESTTASQLTDTVQPDKEQSTLVPDTPLGSILDIGEEWRQNGVGLRLTRYELYPDDSYGETFGVAFEFWNYTTEDLIVSYSKDDFLATSGVGNPISVEGFYNRTWWCNENTDVVKAGERYKIEDGAECGFNTLLYINVDFSNPNITEVVVRVLRFSRITDAQWRIRLQR